MVEDRIVMTMGCLDEKLVKGTWKVKMEISPRPRIALTLVSISGIGPHISDQVFIDMIHP